MYKIIKNILFVSLLSLLTSNAYSVLPVLSDSDTSDTTSTDSTQTSGDSADESVRIRQLSFDVRNVNRSLVACPSDGKAYTVRGQIVAPPGAPDTAATLYLHGLGYGNFFWRFNDVDGLDYAVNMARLGHTSVVIDRLGYDATDHPSGFDTCIGAQADIAHQIIEKLRSGDYQINQGQIRTYERIALAGHSAGGLIAQVAAYSFDNMDALAVLSYGDTGVSPEAFAAVGKSELICSLGGERAEPAEPSGYAFFGQTEADFQSLHFFDASSAVRTAATALRNRDPCGDFNSLTTGIALNATRISTITDPVLILCGNEDAIFPPPSCQTQADLYTGTQDLTTSFLEGIGHALTLERRAPVFRGIISEWLAKRGF